MRFKHHTVLEQQGQGAGHQQIEIALQPVQCEFSFLQIMLFGVFAKQLRQLALAHRVP